MVLAPRALTLCAVFSVIHPECMLPCGFFFRKHMSLGGSQTESPRSFVLRNGKRDGLGLFLELRELYCYNTASNCLARGGTMFSVHWNS